MTNVFLGSSGLASSQFQGALASIKPKHSKASEAKKLAPDSIGNIPDDALKDALKKMMRSGVALPPNTQKSLVVREVQACMKELGKAVKPDGLKHLLDTVDPFMKAKPNARVSKAFDPFGPKLGHILDMSQAGLLLGWLVGAFANAGFAAQTVVGH